MQRLSLFLVLATTVIFGAADYDGNWQGGCEKGNDQYSRDSLSINDTFITSRRGIFSSSQCTNLYLDIISTATIEYGSLSQAVAFSREVQILVLKVVMTPKSLFVASAMNAKQVCGITNWNAGVSQSIAGLVCDGVKIPKLGEIRYDLFSRRDNELFGGKMTEEFDGSTFEKRPRELDTENPFSKIRFFRFVNKKLN